MSEQDSMPSMQEMMTQMARMQAELDSLKARTQTLSQLEEQAVSPTPVPTITSTRRKTLKRLGLALLGGAVAATATDFSAADAKMTVKPTWGTSTSKIGAVVIPPGGTVSSNNPPNGNFYGLIASTGTIDLAGLPTGDTGVYGSGNYGIYGSGSSYGVYGRGSSYGVYGETNAITSFTYGVAGYSLNGSDGSAGVYGIGKNIGVFGVGKDGTTSPNVAGGVGIYARPGANQSLGAHIEKNCLVDGTLTANIISANSANAGVKNFKIDHPLDPENKYLYHTSIESPDMRNLYDGVVSLDEQGEAVVEMPDWFEALNFDFRYQLTCLGQYSQVYISEEMNERKFKIAGGLAGQRISWQVTGIRQDAFAKANRVPVEVATYILDKINLTPI